MLGTQQFRRSLLPNSGTMNSQTPSSRQKGSAPSEVMTATYQPLDQTDGSGRSMESPEWRHAGDAQRIRDWLGGGFMWFPTFFSLHPDLWKNDPI